VRSQEGERRCRLPRDSQPTDKDIRAVAVNSESKLSSQMPEPVDRFWRPRVIEKENELGFRLVYP
jgi:hypothetical protein